VPDKLKPVPKQQLFKHRICFTLAPGRAVTKAQTFDRCPVVFTQ
jgi:hypothetical protein